VAVTWFLLLRVVSAPSCLFQPLSLTRTSKPPVDLDQMGRRGVGVRGADGGLGVGGGVVKIVKIISK